MTEDTEDECQCDSAKEFIPVTFLPSNTAGSQCQAQKPSLVTDICGPRLAVEVYFTQGGTVVVFSIRQPGYLCTLTLFARADL